MKIFILGINLAIFSLFYLIWYSREKQTAELEEWLKAQDREDILPVIEHHGIWSKHALVSTWIAEFNSELLKHESFRDTFRDVKARLRMEMKLAMFLRDKGLPEFVALQKVDPQTNLQDIGFWYPGEIFNHINSIDKLSHSERFTIRTHVHKFKAAVREFTSGQSSTILNMQMKHDKELEKPPSLKDVLDGDMITFYLKREPIQVAYMLLYAIAGHIITTLGVPNKNPGTSNVLLALVLFWFYPDLARFCVYVTLLYRVRVDPVKTVVYAGCLHLWMYSTSSLQIQDKLFGYPIFVMLSVAPTFAFFFFYKILKFQPMVVRDSESGNLDGTFSGVGYVDPLFRKFASTKSIGPIHKFILALGIEAEFDWKDITRMRTEDVDASWDVLKQLMLPPIENNKLNTLWIMNNRLFDDDAAKELASHLKENKVLENLRIVFDYNYKVWEIGYHFFLWDNIPATLTSKGVKSIVEAIKSNKEIPMKLLDFYGTELDEECIKICRELYEKREIGIMGSKSRQIVQSVFDRFFQFRIIKLMSAVGVLAYVSFMVHKLIL